MGSKKVDIKSNFNDTQLSDLAKDLTTHNYNPITGLGTRFFDLNRDGYPDRLSSSITSEIPDSTTNTNISYFSQLLQPRFQAETNGEPIKLVNESDANANANIRLIAELTKPSTRTSTLGYVVLENNEDPTQWNFDTFKQRARSLVTSLGSWVDRSTLPTQEATSDILMNTGQGLRFFELDSKGLDELNEFGDQSFSWLNTTTIQADQTTLQVASSNGNELQVEIAKEKKEKFQGLDELIASQQDRAPILDFTAFSPDQSISGTLTIGREAFLDSITGFYVVDNIHGAVTLAGSTFLPGDPGYTDAALARKVDVISNRHVANGTTEHWAFSLQGGQLLAPMATVQNTGHTHFAFAEANPDGISHFQTGGTNLFQYEDLPGGGDRDYQDASIHFTFNTKFLM